jgi:cytochrome c553
MLFRKLIFTLIYIALSSVSSAALADGAAIYNSSCIGCHNQAVGSVPLPLLSGLNKNYLIKQLEDFRSGARRDRTLQVMNDITKPFSDDTIEQLAEYISHQDPCWNQAPVAGVDIKLGERVAREHGCLSCHKADSNVENAPVLEGQNYTYLQNQLESFKTEKRNNHWMWDVTQSMPPNQFEAVSKYLGNLGCHK